MIQQLSIDELEINELKKSFPQILGKINVKEQLIDNIFTRYLTYKVDNQTIGFIHYDILYERAELIDIAVKDNYQNQGIGNKLIQQMIEECILEKCENITLEVRENNNNAIYLYEKNGFQKVAIRKNYYGEQDGILMKKELIK